MQRLSSHPISWAILALVWICSIVATAATNSFVEDFTTKQFCDTTLTTALWDTVAAEVRLPPFMASAAGSYDTPGLAYGVVVEGDYAFVADDAAGLVVIDISDPTLPTYAGRYNTAGSARDVAVAGDHAYVADYGAGLVVLDISDPTSPVLVGSYDTAGLAEGVAVVGDHAFVADGGTDGLVVIDISVPATPIFVGSLDTDGYCRKLVVAGDRLYAADGQPGLKVIDITDPSNPTLVGTYDTPGDAQDIVLDGDHAFIADAANGLHVVDISDPSSPVAAGNLATPGSALGVAVSGNRAFVAIEEVGLQIVDIFDPALPVLLQNLATGHEAYDVVVAGEFAYVADSEAGLQVVRIAESGAPEQFSLTNTGGYAFTPAIAGDYVYIANYTDGLCVMDISDPLASALVGSYAPAFEVFYDVAVAGDHLFTTGAYDLRVFDISDPVTLAPLDSLDAPSAGIGHGIALAGDYAYVADYDGDLQVFQIRDPAAVTHVASCATPGWALDVAVAGDHAYLATNSGDLQVIDISDPTVPTVVGGYVTASEVRGVAVEGNYAFLANYDGGFTVVDISDPTTPVLAGSCVTAGYPEDVVIVGDYAFLAGAIVSLEKIDISDPTAPTPVGSLNIGSNAMGIAAAGDFLYVAHWYSGLWVVQGFNSYLALDSGLVQSLAIGPQDSDILLLSLEATTNSAFDFEISVDAGLNWQAATGGAVWDEAGDPGTWLQWRSTLNILDQPPWNPTCSQLELEWRYEYPVIESVVDIPGDQGGMVRLDFARSGHDFVKAVGVLESYNVLRRVDSPVLLKQLAQSPPLAPEATGAWPVRELGERRFLVADAGAQKNGLADGTWEVIGSFNAMQQDRYLFPAATLADSAAAIPFAVFCVTAHTQDPLIWYASPPDSGYSVDNIAPGVPTTVSAAYGAGGVALDWDDAPEPDFQYFRIYRGSDPGFVPSSANLLQEVAASVWTDPTADPWGYHYKITVLDHAGNESEAGSPATVSGVQDGFVPTRIVLLDAVPNPFNPQTTISFDLPARTAVSLRVFDVSGRLLRVLLKDEIIESGRHEAVWNGRDQAGRTVAAGVYFYRLDAGRSSETKRMTLVK